MKRTSKLLVLLLSLSLLLGAIVGLSVTASAEEGPTAEIKGKNMSYTGAVQVMYYLKVEGLEAGAIGERVKLLVSDAPITVVEGDTIPDDVSVKIHRGNLTVAETEYAIFFSDAIAPAELRKPIYAVPVILDAEDATKIAYAGTASEYSPYTYAINRFSQSPTPDQKTLYKALLDYGAAVQDVLLTDDEIAANGGWADQYYYYQVNELVNGVLKNEGTAEYHRPSDIYVAESWLSENEVFEGFTLDNGEYVFDEGKSFASVLVTTDSIADPSARVLNANYSTYIGAVENFDEFSAKQYYNISQTPFGQEITDTTNGYANIVEDEGNKLLTIGRETNTGNTGGLYNVGYRRGDTFVFDTDLKITTNYKYNGSGDYWLFKIYFGAGVNQSSYGEVSQTNVTFFTNDGVNFVIKTSGNTKSSASFKATDGFHLRYEYTPGGKTYIYVNDNLMISGTAASKDACTYLNSININTRGAGNLKRDDSTPETVKVKFELDNTYVGALVSPVENGVYSNTVDFDSLSSLSSVNGGISSDMTVDGSYTATGKGYAALVDEGNGNKYLEVGRGSGAGEVAFGVKNSMSTAPTDWSIEFDFKVEDVIVKSSKAKNNWPIRIRIGGNSDGTALTNIILTYNLDTGKVRDNGSNYFFDLDQWVHIKVMYYADTNTRVLYIDGVVCSLSNYTTSNQGTVSKVPYVLFGTRGGSESASDDITTDEVESATVQRYPTVRMAADNMSFRGYYFVKNGIGENVAASEDYTENGEDIVLDKEIISSYKGGNLILNSIPESDTYTAFDVIDGELVFKTGSSNCKWAPLAFANQTPDVVAAVGDKYVFETDIMFLAAGQTATTNVAFIGFSATSVEGNTKMLNAINLYANNGGGWTVGNYSETRMANDRWYNLRIEYVIAAENKGTVNIYIDNNLVKTIADNDGTIANLKSIGFEFAFRNTDSAAKGVEIKFDNTYVATVKATVTADAEN